MNLKNIHNIYFVGIGGIGMSAIARYFAVNGKQVAGYDKTPSQITKDLENVGVEIHFEDALKSIPISFLNKDKTLVVYTPAIPKNHSELNYFLDNKFTVLKRAEILGEITQSTFCLAVSGTHGKTTTSSMLTWILEYAHLSPGFLIGGIPQNFSCSARLGNAPFFVIEADEYDTAFFDKRSKFVHYRPRTLVINNLEFDHGDIFDDLSDIQRQFHHLIRMVPSNGLILSPTNELAINDTLAMGCWTPTEHSACANGWQAEKLIADGSEFIVTFKGKEQGIVKWPLIGDFNIENGLMAIAAARHVGVPSHVAIEALAQFVNSKRRFELRGVANDISVYDDFAHHPTAIAKTLAGVRAKVDNQNGKNTQKGRVIAVLEPRSNTMKSGVHKAALPLSLAQADQVFIFQDENIKWSVSDLIETCQPPCFVEKNIDDLVVKIVEQSQVGDTIVVMSNGGFANIHEKILTAINCK